MKRQAFYCSAGALGDLICATPTIRKLSEIFKSPITVITKQPGIFKNLPYVEESLNFDDKSEEEYRQYFDLHRTFHQTGRKDQHGVEFKHALCDIRQYHAKDLGFMLTPDELKCDYFPKSDEDCLSKFNLPEKYVVIHPSQSWSSRTWSKENWQSLCNLCGNMGIPVVVVGRDAHEESVYYSNNDKPIFKLTLSNGLDLTNQTTLDETWHVVNNALCVITMDSGLLHIAGTTDTYIIQLGSSIKPEYRAPWRNSSQSYKYSYIVGDCKLHCASDLKYSLRDWGTIQSVTLIGNCLEKKPKFECNPSLPQVFEKLSSIWYSESPKSDKVKSQVEKKNFNKTLVEIVSNSIGDNIGALAVIEKFRIENNKQVTVLTDFPHLFQNSYPEIKILKKSENDFSFSTLEKNWTLNGEIYSEKITTTYKFDQPLIDGYAKDFGIESKGVTLKVDGAKKERPIKNKYVCIGVHSTCQAKYWNHPGAWDILCKMLRKKGLTPVCVEKDFLFGIQGHFNEVPHNAVKKIGLPFDDVINHIQHAEMFIGLSSGLSWIAQGLGKPTVIISNVTSKDNEYIDDKTLRIYEESVCHGCFHKHQFNPGDWLWCPVYRDDEHRRFICTKAITPESVMEKIEKFYNI